MSPVNLPADQRHAIHGMLAEAAEAHEIGSEKTPEWQQTSLYILADPFKGHPLRINIRGLVH